MAEINQEQSPSLDAGKLRDLVWSCFVNYVRTFEQAGTYEPAPSTGK